MGLRRFFSNWVRHPRDCRSALNNIQHQLDRIDFTESIEKSLYRFHLQDKTLHDQEMGISNELYDNEEIIVSLTTFGNRIHNVFLPIESIMQGSVKPSRIILWLSKDEFNGMTLPKTLQNQQSRGLEICYCDDLKSYKKLIPTMCQNPNAVIITIDDDVMYEYDVLERMLIKHQNSPNAICACRMHRITLDSTEMPRSYLEWDGEIDDENVSRLNFPTGVGGILYPPMCFNKEVFNRDVFLSICSKADDIWFYAMAVLNDTPIVKVKTDNPSGSYYALPNSPDSLYISNTDPKCCGNDMQLKSVFEYYNLFEKLKN